MIVNFTIPPLQYSQTWMSQTVDAVKRAMLSVVSKDEAAPRIILRSPDGTIYSVTVSDAGALVVAAMSGKNLNYIVLRDSVSKILLRDGTSKFLRRA